MTPFELAARWHRLHCPGDSLAEIVEAHFQAGIVVAGPDLFLLARPVFAAWPPASIGDPWQADPGGDCWHVWLFAGDLAAIPRIVPRPLPFVSFHRRGTRFARLPFSRLLRSLSRE